MHSTADTSPTKPVSRHVPQPPRHPLVAFCIGVVTVLRWTAFVLFRPFTILASLLPIVVVVVLVLMLFDVLPSGSFLVVVLAAVASWVVSWVLFLVSPTRAKKHFDGFGGAASDAGELVDAFFYYRWMFGLFWNLLKILWWLVSAPFRLIASFFD